MVWDVPGASTQKAFGSPEHRAQFGRPDDAATGLDPGQPLVCPWIVHREREGQVEAAPPWLQISARTSIENRYFFIFNKGLYLKHILPHLEIVHSFR